MSHPDLRALGEHAYSAALNDDLWRSWTESMIANFDSQGGLFWVIDATRAEMCRNYFVFRDVDPEEMAAEYLSGPVELDPQMNRVCTSRRSEIYRDTDHVDIDDPKTREYLSWQVDRCGTRHHMTASVVLSDGIEAGISIHRSPEMGRFDSLKLRQLKLLFPHIAHALRLGLQHHHALQEAWWDGLGHRFDEGVMLLDETGGVLRLTSRAEAILRANDGIALSGGRLLAAQGDNTLQGLIQGAIRPVFPEAGAMTVKRDSSGHSHFLTIYPLTRKYRFLAPFEAAAIVRIIDPRVRPKPLTEVQREMFQMSPREADVANLLLANHSIESTAAVLGMSPNTAKVHLQSLFRKTGTSRQSELLMLLLASG